MSHLFRFARKVAQRIGGPPDKPASLTQHGGGGMEGVGDEGPAGEGGSRVLEGGRDFAGPGRDATCFLGGGRVAWQFAGLVFVRSSWEGSEDQPGIADVQRARTGRSFARVSSPRIPVRWCVALMSLGAFGACRPAALSPVRFRTLAPSTAFERAVASVQTVCGGVHRADEKAGKIVSDWWDADFGQGIPPKFIYVRYLVSVVPNRADDSADVRVEPQAVLCPLWASKEADKRVSDCGPLESQFGAVVPSSVYEHHARVTRSIEEDVFRRE